MGLPASADTRRWVSWRRWSPATSRPPTATSTCHSPAVVLAAEPLDRARPARRARGRGHGLHNLLAARPGTAHRPLPERRPGGLAGEQERLVVARPPHGADDGQGAGAERDRGRPRPDAPTDGAGLDAARPTRDLDPDSARAASPS